MDKDYGKYYISKLENHHDFFEYIAQFSKIDIVYRININSYQVRFCHGRKISRLHELNNNSILDQKDSFVFLTSDFRYGNQKINSYNIDSHILVMHRDNKESLFKIMLLYLMLGRKAYEL